MIEVAADDKGNEGDDFETLVSRPEGIFKHVVGCNKDQADNPRLDPPKKHVHEAEFFLFRKEEIGEGNHNHGLGRRDP